jgi:prepilin-type N-terminal cleavage/methylation domain-containing protein
LEGAVIGVKGFTLLELIIVMLIIGIALGFISITIYYGASPLELNVFVKDVSATLRYARSHAVAEKRVYSFIMWKDKRAYSLYVDFSNDEETEEPVPVIYKSVPDPLETFFKNSSSRHVGIDSEIDTFRIDFFPQGNSSGGIMEVRNQKGKAFLIMVNKVTGKVEVKNAEK